MGIDGLRPIHGKNYFVRFMMEIGISYYDITKLIFFLIVENKEKRPSVCKRVHQRIGVYYWLTWSTQFDVNSNDSLSVLVRCV